MRIALDLSPACGQWTGVGRYVRDLARGLVESGLDPAGVYQGHHGPPDDVDRWCQTRHRYDFIGGRIGLALRLPGLLRRERIDLYHATTCIGAPGKGWRGRMVATIHDCFPLDPHLPTSAHDRRRFARLFAAVRTRARLIICPSTTAAAQIRTHGWDGPVHVIPHGLAPAAPASRPPQAPPVYLLSIGAIEPRKGLDRLARSLGAESGRPPWFHLGPLRSDPDGAISAAMTAAGCHRLGWLPETERLAWLAGAEILLHPSIAEGFGYVPFEALQLGIPVAAYPTPVARELLDAGVRWVEADWRAAVTALLAAPAERAALAEAGRVLVARRDLRGMALAHLAAYREALAD